MAATMKGKLIGLYVLLCASFTSQAYVQINDHRHIGNDEQVLHRQKNYLLGVCGRDEIKPQEGSRCTRFVKCVGGQWYFEANKCPPNLLWNGDKSSCDYSGNVDVSTCTSRHHQFNSHTPSTDFRTTAPTTTVHNPHGTTCGPSECFNGRCYSSHICDQYGRCGERHYGCDCNRGYVGDMCDQFKVNEQHCVNQGFQCHHGDCVNTDVEADYACHCWNGYVGKHCEKHLVADSHCSAVQLHCLHGDCVYSTVHMNYGCHCSGHYTGNQCDIQNANSGSGTIAPTTTVHPTTTEPPTHVPQHGQSCGHYECFHGSCETHSYYHNGYYGNYHSCGCYNGYVGDNCNQRLAYTTHCKEAGLNCHHGCVYDTVQFEYACHCNTGYTGKLCSLQQAKDSDCWNTHLQCHHGECVHPIGYSNYSCLCTPEYTGKQCSLRIVSNNECTSHYHRCIHGQCLHDTYSDSSARSYSCDCHHGYTGEHCDNQIATTTPQPTPSTTTSTTTTTPSTTATTTPQPTPSTTTSTTTTTPILTSTATVSATSIASEVTTSKVPITTTTSTVTPSPTQTTTAKPPITTPTSAPTTSTPSTAPTTTVPIHYIKCDKLATVMDLGNQIPVNDTNGGSCPSGSFATPEAFVFDHCNVTPSSNWTQGFNIMKQCNDIPLYTPVATFSNQAYAPSGGLSGIFLGCLPKGIKLGVQQCGNLPNIIHVTYGGLFTMNPDLYYTVQ